jgi:hypothetical protein
MLLLLLEADAVEAVSSPAPASKEASKREGGSGTLLGSCWC